MRRSAVTSCLTAVGLLLPSLTFAITHENDYVTNLDNYRVCDAVNPLSTCTYSATLSPSPFYLDGGTKGTLVYSSAGEVRLRIDAVKLDTNHPAWACANHDYTCGVKAGSSCPGGKECVTGPKSGTTPPNCCTIDDHCDVFQCVDGPQNDVTCASNADCDDLDNGAPWHVVFTGNLPGSYLTGGGWLFKLFGEANVGCRLSCPFTLGGTATSGSINTSTSGLTNCEMTGDFTCASVGPGDWHEVMIEDPEGNPFAIPSIGNATILTGLSDGDPAKLGDCDRLPKPAPCP